jgi:hypothetical protein
MFNSLLRSKQRRPSETTPLLAALSKYRSRRNLDVDAEDDSPDGIAQYHGGEDEQEEDYEEDEDRRRDGPLLPVFSSTFLGVRR